MPRRLLALLLPLLSLAGCGDRSRSSSATLSNDELLKLMGGELFEIAIPKTIKAEQFGGLVIRHADGTIDTLPSSTHWTPGETVKVVCFTPEGTHFRFSWFRKEGYGGGSTVNFPASGMRGRIAPSSPIAPGGTLMRYSRDNSLAYTPTAEGDDFDIIFQITP